MWEAKSSGAVNVRKNEFIESINLRWENRISARNGVYEIKKLHIIISLGKQTSVSIQN
jgi:hypothetical protein